MVILKSCLIRHTSAERTWLCIRLNDAGKYCDRSAYRRCRFKQKISSFQMKLILILVCKQTKLSHLGHRKRARIYRKADSPKTNEYGCVYAWTKLRNIATDRPTEDADFGKKKHHLFPWSSFWSWRARKTRTHTYKSQCTQNETLFAADFGPAT